MKFKPKPASSSVTQLADVIFPHHANAMGTAFGGIVMAMADKAAGVCAMRHSGQTCVTVAMDRVEFLVPISVGHVLIAEARVNYVGRTSIEVG
ncbi:MAG: acyl-CoA thioesterase, partial [Elusimicrobia bacterium]|nr:acyl-CoA thioesterase [Elusimicrobiota bacterium]